MNILLILAGDPPSENLLKTQIELADVTIAVDGGTEVFVKFNLSPDLILGDLDSVRGEFYQDTQVIEQSDQDYTDLQKALKYILNQYSVNSLVLLGGTGGRTDHLLHNLHICADIDFSVKVTFLSEKSVDGQNVMEIIQRITPSIYFDSRVKVGTIISVLPVTHYEGLTSKGLEWELTSKNSNDQSISQSNQARITDPEFNLFTGCVYIAVYQ